MLEGSQLVSNYEVVEAGLSKTGWKALDVDGVAHNMWSEPR